MKILGGGAAILLAAGALVGSGILIRNFVGDLALEKVDTERSVPKDDEPSIEDLIQKARERSRNVKGVYMTAVVANDKSKAATKLRNNIIRLLDTTELHGVVVDIKETDGVFLPESLKDFIAELHKKDIWVIARLVVFNDTVEAKKRPEIALKRKSGKLWLDQRGNAWLDPASPKTWEYIVGVSKKAIDYGFDEVQFDYIRFPSDGDVENIVYPVFNPKTQQKYDVLRGLFVYLNRELKAYKPDVILSADLFGYVAIQKSDLGIGQRMEDLGDSFDYISFMVYPSHYYTGFKVPADSRRGLPALDYPYKSKNAAKVASNQPYDVVYRSLLVASDFLAGKDVFSKATSSVPVGEPATTTPLKEVLVTAPRSKAKLRPWLQNFDLAFDTNRGIYYDVKKVRAQIDAAEAAGSAGWMLWNPNNVYTEPALKKE